MWAALWPLEENHVNLEIIEKFKDLKPQEFVACKVKKKRRKSFFPLSEAERERVEMNQVAAIVYLWLTWPQVSRGLLFANFVMFGNMFQVSNCSTLWKLGQFRNSGSGWPALTCTTRVLHVHVIYIIAFTIK